MDILKQSWFLFKVIRKNSSGLTKSNKKEKKSKRIGMIIGTIVLGIVFGGIFALQSFLTAWTAAQTNPAMLPNLLTVFYFVGQCAILFLGVFSTLGTFFFSKDNMLLNTLPVKKTSIFLAKFLYCYLSELFISVAVVLTMVTAFAAGCIVGGVKLTAWFFIVEIISIFIVPVLPLLIITILSFPMMYLVSIIKKSKVATLVLNVLVLLLFMGICFVPSMMSMGMQGTDGNISADLNIYASISNVTIFNLPLTNSMFGINAAGNFFAYFGIMIVAFIAVVFLSAATYPRILARMMESNSATKSKKNRKKVEYTALSFQKTYMKKEIKSIISAPTILANLILPLVLVPVFIFLFVKGGIFRGISGTGGEFAVAGFVLYLACIIAVSSNPMAMMGFSMEGKNILFLKTLPLSAKKMVKLKLRIADALDLVIALIVFVSFSIASVRHDVLLAAILGIVIFGFGMAFNRFGLYNDLKKPFLNWQNIQEINKNNKRSVKPMLIAIGACILFLVIGGVFDAAGAAIPEYLKYILFASVGVLVDTLVYIFTAKKLFDNADELWEKIEE